MKIYSTLFSILTAVSLTAADAVTSATPQYKEQNQPIAKKANPVQKKKAAVKPANPGKKKKAAVNKKRKNNKKAAAPASVNISSFAPDAKDATAAFEKAIRTRAKEIVFDKAGTYVLRPVKLPRNVRIILKEDVKISGLAPEKAENPLPGLFNIDSVAKIVVKGSGNTVTAPQGLPVFSIKNANNVELRDLTIGNSCSGIKIANSYGVKMYNMVFDSIKNNALEIDGGNWNSIYDSQFRNLGGSGAIIVSRKDGLLPNITVDNCEFFNSRSGLALRRPEKISAKAPDKKARPARFAIRSCRFFNNTGIDVELNGDLTFGDIRIDNNLFTNKLNTALKLVNFTTAPDAVTLQINSCSFNPGDTNLQPPIVCMGTTDQPVGNVKFINTAVASPVHKKAICFDLRKKSGKLEGILPVIAADGSRLNAILTVEEK